jgi:hypothetical protein
MGLRLTTLRAAAAVQLAEAVLVLVATALAGIDALGGQSYHVSSGIALTVIGAASALALAWVGVGVARGRPWSRTPALLTQLFVGIVGIYLLQGHRLDWGALSVALAVAGFATLLAPPSLRTLAGGPRSGEKPAGEGPPAGKPPDGKMGGKTAGGKTGGTGQRRGVTRRQ